jgi:chlorophyllide a reductase subunit Z
VEGIGAEINMIFPLGCPLDDVVSLADADANVCLYREYGRKLCEALETPYFQAPIGLDSTTKVPPRPRRRAGPRPRALY